LEEEEEEEDDDDDEEDAPPAGEVGASLAPAPVIFGAEDEDGGGGEGDDADEEIADGDAFGIGGSGGSDCEVLVAVAAGVVASDAEEVGNADEVRSATSLFSIIIGEDIAFASNS
jgi:hypothetical protein